MFKIQYSMFKVQKSNFKGVELFTLSHRGRSKTFEN